MGDLQHLGVTAVWADHLNAERQHRNVIDNTERGLKFSLGDVGWAQADQTAVCKRFAAFFKEVDVLICPAASVSPIPLSRLCVEEINDKRMATYMRWLAIAYAPTMALACAATLPCGVDHLGAWRIRNNATIRICVTNPDRAPPGPDGPSRSVRGSMNSPWTGEMTLNV